MLLRIGVLVLMGPLCTLNKPTYLPTGSGLSADEVGIFRPLDCAWRSSLVFLQRLRSSSKIQQNLHSAALQTVRGMTSISTYLLNSHSAEQSTAGRTAMLSYSAFSLLCGQLVNIRLLTSVHCRRLIPGLSNSGGFDASVHISEEASNASVAVPWALMIAVTVSSVLGWGTCVFPFYVKARLTKATLGINVALAFNMGSDMNLLLESPIGQPMAAVRCTPHQCQTAC